MKKTKVSLSPIVSKAGALTITNEKSMAKAVSILSQLNRERDRIVADKEKLTKPLNETLKEIRGRYKPFEAKLDEAIGYIRAQMTAYQTELTEKAQKEAAAIAEKIGDSLSIEGALAEMENVEQAIQRVDTSHGSVSFRTVQKWRLVDFDKVPRQFLELDEIAITANMKSSSPIEGIEYYTEKQPINRR